MQKETNLRLINFERSYYNKNKTKYANYFSYYILYISLY